MTIYRPSKDNIQGRRLNLTMSYFQVVFSVSSFVGNPVFLKINLNLKSNYLKKNVPEWPQLLCLDIAQKFHSLVFIFLNIFLGGSLGT